MRTTLLILLSLYGCWLSASNDFDCHFLDKTLRIDYTFCGTTRQQQVYLSELMQSDGWYGRRHNLDRLLVEGNGQIVVTDTLHADTLYIHSFSTLFQEWLSTEEAVTTPRSFENTFLIPFPRHAVDVTIRLTDMHRQEQTRMTHRVHPDDILIRHIGQKNFTTPWRYLQHNGDSREKIDMAFVAEGYTRHQMKKFHRDCRKAMQAILSHEPFRSMQDRFNFIAIDCPSLSSGVSIPSKEDWKDTALGSHFSTFYSERYLTTLHIKRLHDILAGIPYEHILLLSNTDKYGGGGIYNSYLMSSVSNEKSLPVVVHELGHSFAGLGDEYFYEHEDLFQEYYPSDVEPWEPNITTLVDFASKWQDMLSPSTAIPTPVDKQEPYTKLGVYQGGGYQTKGVFRPVDECRMRNNEAPGFCPVCQRAIRRMIEFQTEKKKQQ